MPTSQLETERQPVGGSTLSHDEESFHLSGGGERLFRCTYPTENATGVVLLTHGLGEHSGRYSHVVRCFQERNLAVARFDLRGHGRSEGTRGHAPSLEQLMDDVSLMVRITRERFGDLPLVVMGHSLGGNIVVNWVLRRPQESADLAGLVLSSPWFVLCDPPPAWKVAMVRALSQMWPTFPIPNRFRTRKLTRDAQAARRYHNDQLVHRRITVKLATEAFDAARWALEHATECRIPLLAVHGTADAITSPEGTRQFCSTAPNAEMILFDGLVHEPHNEPEWKTVVAKVRDWIVARVQAHRRVR